MELDQLKKLYNTSSINYSRAELQSIFDIRTKGTLQQINKKMLVDGVLMLITAVSLISVTFLLGLRSKYLISSQILGFTVLLFLHYRLKYWLINTIDFEKFGINHAIKRVYNIFKTYWIIYQLCVPLFTVFLCYKLANYLAILNDIDQAILYPSVGVLMLMITSILLKAIYGKEIKKLKELVNSINAKK